MWHPCLFWWRPRWIIWLTLQQGLNMEEMSIWGHCHSKVETFRSDFHPQELCKCPVSFLGRWDKGGVSITEDVSAHLHNLHFNNGFGFHLGILQVPPGHRQPVCLQGTELSGAALQHGSEPKESLEGISPPACAGQAVLGLPWAGKEVPTSSAS